MIGGHKKKDVEIRKVLCLVKNYSYSMSERKRKKEKFAKSESGKKSERV